VERRKSEKVVAGLPTCPNHFQLLSPTHTCPLDAYPTGRKQISEKHLSLFFFAKFFLILFEILEFFKIKRWKIKYAIRKEKNKMAEFWRWRKMKKCKWWKKGGKIKYEITTSLISR
jgi:hypothetical protein